MTIKHGAKLVLPIATGRSRRETRWKNGNITWGELLTKLENTTKTHETMSEYLAMSKQDQDVIKDVGGFVGGTLKDGRRKNGFVICRSIITLDADFAPADLWDDIELLSTYAMAAYSTHKHTAKKPRLRILIPLSRTVSPEEYEAIARKLADEIGIDYFDDTTYEPCRLMYWPSTPKDTEYFFRYIDADPLNPDSILAQYDDWKDTSFWPESSRCTSSRRKAADKQGDPLTKTGLIGAFCRAYPIEDAIRAFIPDVYIECNTPGRWTYSKGSTAAGLVIYDGKYAYSNHGTDPVSGMLCNAFDLIRIHKFGDLDIDAKEDTPVNRLPSWIKMMGMVREDENTRVQIGMDKIESAMDEFDDDFKAPEDNAWLKKMTITKSGEYESTVDNFLLIIKNDPNLKGIGGHDLFRDRFMVQENLPWERSGSSWTDLDDSSLRHYIEKTYCMEGRNKIIDALMIAFEDRAYNPVKDYIESIAWDGQHRIETLLIDYLGATDNDYTRTVTRKTIVAAVKRIYEPGCKFDYMLTIVGKQGIGKSLLIKRLAGEYASDTLTDIKGKEAYEALDGVWIMEMGELAALKRSERESIKNYISKQEDTYRKAFARNVSINKRRCIFIGTTNDKDFLDDNTGARRFWVIDTDARLRTKTVWDDLTTDEVAQIWAEALTLYKAGENIMYLPPEIDAQAKAKQKEHSAYEVYEGICQKFVDTPIPKNWTRMTVLEHQQYYNASEDFKTDNHGDTVQRQRVSAIEIWVEGMGKDTSTINKMIARRINDSLDAIGWVKDPTPQRPVGFGSQRGYRRPAPEEV